MAEFFSMAWSKYGPLGIALAVLAYMLTTQNKSNSEERAANRDILVNHMSALQTACTERRYGRSIPPVKAEPTPLPGAAGVWAAAGRGEIIDLEKIVNPGAAAPVEPPTTAVQAAHRTTP